MLDKERLLPELGSIIRRKLADNDVPLEFFLLIYPQDTSNKNTSYISATPIVDLINVLRGTANMLEEDLKMDVTRQPGET